MRHFARATRYVLSLFLFATVLAAGSAAAQDPVTIVDEEVGGYSAEAIVDWGPASNPNPVIPGTRVEPDAEDLTVRNLTLNRANLCGADQEIVGAVPLPETPDAIPCNVTIDITLTTPCEGAREQLRSTGPTGAAADDQLTAATSLVDKRGNDVSEGIWDGRASKLADDCASAVPAFDGRSAIAESDVLADVRNPRLCPNTFGICIGEAPIGQTFSDQTQPVASAFVTPACRADGAYLECDPLGLAPGTEVPWEKWTEIVNTIPEEARVLRSYLEATNQSTPYAATQNYTLATGSLVSCTVPGRGDPRGDSNTVPYTHTDVRAPESGNAGPATEELGTVARTINDVWTAFFGIWVPINNDVTHTGETANALLYDAWPDDGQFVHREEPVNSGSPLTPQESPGCRSITPPPPPPAPVIEA